MEKYRKYEIMATIAVAIFIVCFSLCILVMDRHVYNWCYEDYEKTLTASDIEEKPLSSFEAEQNYKQLADGFSNFFKSDYSDTSYGITDANVKRLNKLKLYYRLAWLLSIVSIVFMVRAFRELSRVRNYMPLLYGGISAAGLTVLNAFIIMVSNGSTLTGIRNMIMHGDYSYFEDMDLIRWITPPGFAMALALTYLCIVFLMILLAAVIRGIIIFCGRPHKF